MLIQRDQVRSRPFPFQDSPFEAFFGGLDAALGSTSSGVPVIRLEDTEKGFTITAEVPGVSEEDLQIQVQDHRVTVTIRDEEGDNAEASAHRFAGFKRSFRFRTALHSECAEARLEKGILHIHLPKAASAVPRTLPLSPSN